ncbi:MAG: helix-turn-helix domain-containing protein [Desulfobacteraceae bacterium]|nr:helix-turn-helix domain-containing protein [Desulfobacteraceae bacterium]
MDFCAFAGNDQLLTCEQAATMLQIPEDTLRAWRTVRGNGGHKKPPFIRIGRRIRYRLGDLRRYISEMA